MANVGKDKLTPRQRTLAEFFLRAECKTDPATLTNIYRKAGFKGEKKTAAIVAERILNHPWVKKYIQDRIAENVAELKETDASLQAVLERYAIWMHYDVRKLYHPDGRLKEPIELDDKTAASVLGVDVEVHNNQRTGDEQTRSKVRVIDPKGAADSLARLLAGGFSNEVDFNVRGELTHNVNVKGGVLLVPSTKTMEEWVSMVPGLKEFKDKQKKLIGFDEVTKATREDKK